VTFFFSQQHTHIHTHTHNTHRERETPPLSYGPVDDLFAVGHIMLRWLNPQEVPPNLQYHAREHFYQKWCHVRGQSAPCKQLVAFFDQLQDEKRCDAESEARSVQRLHYSLPIALGSSLFFNFSLFLCILYDRNHLFLLRLRLSRA